MAFALLINQLLPALQQPGCPICNLQRASVQRFLAAFLQENLMDRQARQAVLDSRGFCPGHTFQLAAMEMRTDGSPLGTAILHQHINIQVQSSLRAWLTRPRAFLGRFIPARLRRFFQSQSPVECPVCAGMRQNDARALAALMDELGKGSAEINEVYTGGDGICLVHLRQAISMQNSVHPAGLQFLVQNTINRLEAQQTGLKEYIRKHNASYQDEKITPTEDRAWRSALGFHSGYPPAVFGPFTQKPD